MMQRGWGPELARRAERASLPWLLVSVVGSALAMGGAVPSWFLPLGLAITLAGVVVSLASRQRRATAWPAVVFAGLAVYCLVQALPLPINWVRTLSPVAADVWSRSLLPVGAQVTRGSLSLAPSASLFEALKWSSYAATFSVAALVGRTRGANWGLAVVFASAVAVALVSLSHAVFGASTVYGVYKPMNVFATGVGPFLNPNNLAAYLNLGALVGFGLILARTPVVSRWLLGAGLVTIVAVSLRAGSRGGVATLLLGIIALAAWAVVNRRHTIAATGRAAWVAIAGLPLLAALFGVVGADKRFWAELLSENSEKLRMPLWTIPVIRDYPWFGVGRGAFESVFFAYRPATGNTAFTHPENFIAQWLSEWGVPISAIAAVALIWSLAPLRRGIFRSAIVMGGLCGIGTLLIQNLADLSLELAGVGVAATAVLGAIWGSVRQASALRPRRSVFAPWLIRGLLTIGFWAGVWAALVGVNGVDEDRARVRALIAQAAQERTVSGPTRNHLRGEIRRMLERHPADYYFPLAGAYVARMDRENPMPWIQRALERGPTIGRVHILLGEVLAERGLLNQSLLELRIGVSYEPALSETAARIAVAHTRDAESLMRAVPEGPEGARMLDALATALPQGAVVARVRMDTEALLRDERLINPRRRLVDSSLDALHSKQPPCEDVAACTSRLEDHAAAFARVVPSSTLGSRTRARLLWTQGRAAEAAELLSEGCSLPGERAACLLLRVQIVAELGQPAALTAAVGAYLDASCVDRKACAEANDWVAQFRAARAEHLQAVTAFERAARDSPTEDRWLRLADAAERAGLTTTAVNALQQVLSLRGSKDEAIQQRILALQRAER